MSVRNPATTAVLAALALALVAAPAMAQTGYISPSLSAGLVYDDNTTSSATDPQDDFILRVTPAIEAGWRGPRGLFSAIHSFDMERYKENTRFDDVQIRRHTRVEGDYRVTERLDFAASATTAATDAPGDLVPDLGLELGRVGGARRHTADAEVAYRVTRRMTATAGAGWTLDDVSSGTETTTALGAVGAAFMASERHTWTADYVYRRYEFDSATPIEAHIGLFGWETAMSPRSSLVVQAGPRYTDGGDTTPEVLVATTYDMPASSLSFNFERSMRSVIGRSGLADSYTAWLTYMHRMNADLSLQFTPSYTKLERGDRAVDVARAFVEARYLLNRNLSLRGSYQWRRQDGSLDTLGSPEIDRNVVFVGAVWEFIPQPMTTESSTRRR